MKKSNVFPFFFLLAGILCVVVPVSGQSSSTKTSGQSSAAASRPTSTSTMSNKPLTETNWKVVELNGQNVQGKTAKEMYFFFDPSSAQFKSHSGCNLVIGEAKRPGGNSLQFTNIINSSQECSTPTIDADFLNAVQSVRQYTITGNTLLLKKDSTTVLIKCVAK